jgi:hypothetical protein
MPSSPLTFFAFASSSWMISSRARSSSVGRRSKLTVRTCRMNSSRVIWPMSSQKFSRQRINSLAEILQLGETSLFSLMNRSRTVRRCSGHCQKSYTGGLDGICEMHSSVKRAPVAQTSDFATKWRLLICGVLASRKGNALSIRLAIHLCNVDRVRKSLHRRLGHRRAGLMM